MSSGQPYFDKTLYKTHSDGSIGSWQVTVTGCTTNATMEVIATKKLGGKGVSTKNTFTEGKNIGRSNETTAADQAVKEAKSKVQKKMDGGYLTEVPKEGSQATNGLGFLKPMLAQPIEKVKQWDFPVAIQPKLDGHRMLAVVKDGEVVLYSRQGKILDVEHIRSQLQDVYRHGIWSGNTLDGEVYAHGETLQTITSLIKKPKPESINLHYHVYDTDQSAEYPDRYQALLATHGRAADYGITRYWSILRTHQADCESRLNDLHGQFIGEGYEGTIVRQLGFGYEQGKRSKGLMKKKDFQDAEFEIVGVTEGKPNERLKKRVGIYCCKTPDGRDFTVTAPGDADEKHRHANFGHHNVGKMLTVKFFNYTPDGIPFHPVALRVREDI